jgi:hypothetical protein
MAAQTKYLLPVPVINFGMLIDECIYGFLGRFLTVLLRVF